MEIKAISFDFWWTLFYDADGNDGNSVKKERVEILIDASQKLGRVITFDEAKNAFDSASKFFEDRHKNVIFTSKEQMVEHMFEKIGICPPNHVVRTIAFKMSEAGKRSNLSLTNNAAQVIEKLSKKYKLALISDTVLTEGRFLTYFLRKEGILDKFSVLAFSDELGLVKPNRGIFEYVIKKIGINPEEIAHVGDFPWSDIEGAKGAGMLAVQYTGGGNPISQIVSKKADYVIDDLSQLYDIF